MFHTANSAGMRTSLRQQLHSMPPSHRSPYLDGHMLAKQKQRLEKELCLLEQRCYQWRLRLADIASKLRALSEQQNADAARGVEASSPPPRRGDESARVLSMTIDY